MVQDMVESVENKTTKITTTKELFELLQSKLIFDFKEDEVACESCKGLTMTYEEHDGKSFIQRCNKCSSGKQYICKYCGARRMSSPIGCNCDGAYQLRRSFEVAREKERMARCTAIQFDDYQSMLSSIESEERLVDKDDFEQELFDSIQDLYMENGRSFKGLEIDTKVWAFEGSEVFPKNLDNFLIDWADNADAYEGFSDRLNFKSKEFKDLQLAYEKWLETEDNKSYHESSTVVVDISKLIEECMAEVRLGGIYSG